MHRYRVHSTEYLFKTKVLIAGPVKGEVGAQFFVKFTFLNCLCDTQLSQVYLHEKLIKNIW